MLKRITLHCTIGCVPWVVDATYQVAGSRISSREELPDDGAEIADVHTATRDGIAIDELPDDVADRLCELADEWCGEENEETEPDLDEFDLLTREDFLLDCEYDRDFDGS